MNVLDVTLGLAFLAGLASFLSPCVFTLVPAYIGYLGGRSLAEVDENTEAGRWATLTHGIAFVAGFSLVFIAFGIVASSFGGLLYVLRNWVSKVGGVVVVIFGLHMMRVLRIKYLDYDLRPKSLPERRRGYLSSVLMGVFFSAGWSPCVGPVLGAILTLAFNEGSTFRGAQLLTAYSAGLAIPFLLAALGLGWVTTAIRRFGKVLQVVEIAMGVLLIIIGIMLFTGTLEQLARFGYFVDFGL
ncbi:MAG: cytochrome c biogenesis CcdA family protein [Chloroflexota bacterium]